MHHDTARPPIRRPGITATVPQLPEDWITEVRPGVRSLHPPGVEFRWLDLLIDEEIDFDELRTSLAELDMPGELEEVMRDHAGEALRYRHLDTNLLKLELPEELDPSTEKRLLLTIVLRNDTLLTMHRGSIGIIEEACLMLGGSRQKTITPLSVIYAIGEEFLDQLDPIIRKAAKALDEAEDVLEGRHGVDAEALAGIRTDLLEVDRFLDPLQSLLRRVTQGMHQSAGKREELAMRELLDRSGWTDQRVRNQLDRVRVISDRQHIRSMDDMSTSMYRLSWIATIFLPLTFITGLLGINVKGIPEADNPHAFMLVCLFLFILAIGTSFGLALAIRIRKQKNL